jgi:hypothetical protein
MSELKPYILLGGLLISLVVWLAVRRRLRSRVYPSEHGVAAERVLRLVDRIAAGPGRSDNELVGALVGEGVGKVDAELLVRFVPIAFTWAVLKKMGAVGFPSTFVVLDREGRAVEMPISREHYFTAALGVAMDVTTNGFSERVGREVFEAIIMRSAEMNAVGKMAAAGKSVAGSRVLSPTLLGITAEEILAGRGGGR